MKIRKLVSALLLPARSVHVAGPCCRPKSLACRRSAPRRPPSPTAVPRRTARLRSSSRRSPAC